MTSLSASFYSYQLGFYYFFSESLIITLIDDTLIYNNRNLEAGIHSTMMLKETGKLPKIRLNPKLG